ncbi:Gm1141 [Phodopus roborovskii]|uniref:Gm1141 protein n=1 Tax=Phodopus roborovskii TaxID=109678 RepID=A0AAU9YYU6_PHORO|nr:Gm1141 [Phodopus roborovskii]
MKIHFKTKVASNPHQKPTHEDLRNLLKKLQKLMDKLGYGPSRQRPRACPEKCQAAVASASSNQKGVLSVRTDFEHYKVPVFNTYEEFHKTVLQSFENISIVLNIEGRVVFISQNVSPLLGHHPEDIVGKSLLNILLDEEKDEISQKIVLKLPLAHSVGRLIEFCCYLRKGIVGQDSQNRGVDKYEYVKFILYLQDSYDESFVFFGNYGPSSRNIWSSTPRQLWEQKYYLVGTISVLRTKAGSEHPIKIEPPIIIVDSDDDSTIQHDRLRKRRRSNEIERNCQAENVNMEYPGSDNEVCKLTSIETPSPSPSSTCTNPSIISSTSTTTSTNTSMSSTDFTASAAAAAAAPKNMLDPVDMEFEVSSEFLLDDSHEEQAYLEHDESSDEDVEKPLEEAEGSNLKEHVINDTYSASSDDDCCIIEDVEDKKGPKTKEVIVDQGRGHQKAVETAPKRQGTAVQPVRPEAVVGPMPRSTLNFQQPLLGGRFHQLCGQQVRTQVYDLNINRSFEDELPSYRNIEEEEREQEQCEYGLAQHIEILHNLPYERSPAQQQIVQGQKHRVVTVNDVGPLSINFFGNDNSEYLRNDTPRFWDGHVDHTPPMLHVPLTRSRQRTSVPYQPVATTHPLTMTFQSLATVPHHSSARSQHPSERSHVSDSQSSESLDSNIPGQRTSEYFMQLWNNVMHHIAEHHHLVTVNKPWFYSKKEATCYIYPIFVSPDYQREDGPHFVLPGQGNSGYFLAGEDIDLHP